MSFRQILISNKRVNIAPANTTFYEVSKSTSLTSTITIPTSSAVNDFALLVNFGANPQPADTTPSGWTQIQTTADATGVGHRISSFYKYLVSGDIGATLTGYSSGSEGMVLFVFRNVGWTFIPYALAGGLQAQSTLGDPTQQTITPISNKNMSVGVKYTYGGTSAFSTNPFDSTEIVTDGVVGSLLVGYKYQLSTTSSVVFDSGDNGNAQTQQSYYILFDDTA
jgi:hypothetical protein